MYSGTSEQYWKKTKRSHSTKLPRNILIVGFFTLIVFAITLRSSARYEDERRKMMLAESMIRPNPTEENSNMCERNMQDVLRIECDKMCKDEAMSIPRPSMYRSCHHGCSRAFYSAAMVGCREGPESEAFAKMTTESHSSCSRYMHIEPKPNVQSTCKQYYRQGTKEGWKLGSQFIDKLIQIEWDKKQRNLDNR